MDGDQGVCGAKRARPQRGCGVKPNTQDTSSILVVGAGPVGAAAALSLAERGYQVILVDRAPPQPGTAAFGMDVRNVALSPRSAAGAYVNNIELTIGNNGNTGTRGCGRG